MPNNNETTTKFKVDISELKKEMQEAKRQVQIANSEFKAISSSMEDWSKSSDGLSAKLKQLDNNLKSQKTVLSSLEKQYELTVAEMGEGSAQADRLKIAINNQKAVVNSTQREISRYESELDNLVDGTEDAGNSTDELSEDLDKLESQTKSAGDGFTVFKGVLANLATQGINLVIDGAKKAGEALVGMVKDSVGAYAEYEQLIGGVETLFKDSSKTVEDYANNAYKTAGMSANEYMDTVTSFSASLLSALNGDTAESAKIADMAITDMSDNANKMGTDMEMIQNAYNGFAKQNYTMLDNLKLGYGGTQAEMARLLEDAEKLTGKSYDMNNLNDVFEAIHVIQTELGITGTTAKEASTTISGSVATMKSAWQNLLAGMANEDADFSKLVDNLVESVGTMLQNVMPRMIQVLSGVGQLITSLAPIITSELPKLINQVLPPLLSSIGSLIGAVGTAILNALPQLAQTGVQLLKSLADGIISALPQIMSTGAELVEMLYNAIITGVPKLITAGAEMLGKLGEGVAQNLPSLVNKALDALDGFADMLTQNLPTLIQAGLGMIQNLVQGLVNALPTFIAKAPEIISKFANLINDNMPMILKGAVNIIITLVKGLISAIPTLVANIPKIITAIVDVWTAFNWVNLGKQVMTSLKNGITSMIGNLKVAGQNVMDSIANVIKGLPSALFNFGKNGISNLGNALRAGVSSLASVAKNILSGIVKAFNPKALVSVGKDLIKGLWNGISDMTGWIIDKIQGFGDSVVSGLKNFFGIDSPSKLLADEIGKFLPEGIAVGIDKNAKSVMNAMRDLTMNTLGATRDGLIEAGVTGGVTGGVVNNFYQTNNSPKALSRLEIYRQSKNLLGYAGGGM